MEGRREALQPILVTVLAVEVVGEGPQFVFGVGKQVTPPAAHDPPTVGHIGPDVHVIDVDA